MATVTTNVLIKGFRGKFGNDLVFKTVRGRTFASPPAGKPDKKKETQAQRNTRVNFRDATQWAQIILLDPEKKAYYQRRAKALKLPNAYTAAITDYMRKPKVQKVQHRNTITYRISKPGFALKQVQAIINETATSPSQKIVTRQRNDCWLAQYTPDINPPPTLTLIITDNADREARLSVIS